MHVVEGNPFLRRVAERVEVAGGQLLGSVQHAAHDAVAVPHLDPVGAQPQSAQEFVTSPGGSGEAEDSETVGLDEVSPGLMFFFSSSR